MLLINVFNNINPILLSAYATKYINKYPQMTLKPYKPQYMIESNDRVVIGPEKVFLLPQN